MWRLAAMAVTVAGVLACGPGPVEEPGDGGLASMRLDAGPYLALDCSDGRYRESILPDPRASLVGLSLDAGLPALVDDALTRRYPFGRVLVEGARASRLFPQDCSVVFSGGATTVAQALQRLDVVVHECGHIYNLSQGAFTSSVYALQPSQTITCPSVSTFARSRLRGDTFQAARPPCASFGRGCDSYAPIYLDGNPDDTTFQGGDQGYPSVVEETVQYVNSLATSFAFADQVRGQTSARDGLLTFLWYLERYLRRARLEDPPTYARIAEDTCWRELTLNVWGRAWTYLEQTRGDQRLGLEDAALEALVATPELLEEIQRLRRLSGC